MDQNEIEQRIEYLTASNKIQRDILELLTEHVNKQDIKLEHEREIKEIVAQEIEREMKRSSKRQKELTKRSGKSKIRIHKPKG